MSNGSRHTNPGLSPARVYLPDSSEGLEVAHPLFYFQNRLPDVNINPEAGARDELVATVLSRRLNHYPKHFLRSNDPAYFEDISAWAGESKAFQHVHVEFPGMAGSHAPVRRM